MSEHEYKRNLTLQELDEAVGGEKLMTAAFTMGDVDIFIAATSTDHQVWVGAPVK